MIGGNNFDGNSVEVVGSFIDFMEINGKSAEIISAMILQK